MILYCPSCNAIVGKTDETLPQGAKIEKECPRCGKKCAFHVQYKAVRDRNAPYSTE